MSRRFNFVTQISCHRFIFSGEEFLEPKSCDYQANSDDEVFRFDKDHDEESKRIKLVPIESLDTLVDNRLLLVTISTNYH